jgi:MFS family permease
MGKKPFGADAKETLAESLKSYGATFQNALKNPALYLLCLLIGLLATCGSVMQQISGFGSASSLGAMNAAWGLAILSGSAIFVKLLLGTMSDIVGAHWCMMASCGGGAIGLFLILFFGNTGGMIGFSIGCIFFALGYSALGILAPMITRQAFGTRDYIRIYSIATMTLFFFNAVSNSVFAQIFDATGSYNLVFWSAIAMYAMIVLLCPIIIKVSKKSWVED